MAQWMQAIWLAVAWWLVALLSQSMAHAATQTLPVWLGSGVTLAALLGMARAAGGRSACRLRLGHLRPSAGPAGLAAVCRRGGGEHGPGRLGGDRRPP